MNMIQKSVFSIASLLLALCATAQETVSQKDIDLVRYMPERPFPYKMKDWKAIARKQDSLLFDFDAQGTFLPLIWWDNTQTNFPERGFGLPSYVGALRNREKKNRYESLPVIGSVLGASLVGIDKSAQNGHDFVGMCRQFYSKRDNANLILNSPRGRPGGSFWYEIWPGMAFNMLVDQYPGHEEIGKLMLLNAEHWLQAFNGLSNGRAYPNFDFT
ncbi:MAG TPA: hypothetical protein VIR29_14315, partial [Anseongella sp.]